MPDTDHDLSKSIQNYLKAIYRLTLGGAAATTNQIAEQMDLSPSSATVMVQRLARLEPPLVDYHKHQGVFLTPDGRREALRVIRRHRLIELYLVEKLGYAWDEVHADAEQLEHCASERFIDRLAETLGNPFFDPHGDPIPDRDLRVPEQHTLPLAALAPGEKGIVRQVESGETRLLSYLHSLGIAPGIGLEVIDVVPFDRTVQVKLLDSQKGVVFGPEISEHIQVEKIGLPND